MTVLESKANRDAAGIDTIERALVYAAILLRKANTAYFQPSHANYNAVRFITDKSPTAIGKLIISAKIPYNSQQALALAGNFLGSIIALSDVNPSPLLVSLNATPNPPYVLPEEPATINSLERYFVWLCHLFQIGFYATGSGGSPVSITFIEENQGGAILDISLSLQYNAVMYAKEQNLLAAVMPSIVTSLDFQANIDAANLSNTTLGGDSIADVFTYFLDYASGTKAALGGASSSEIEQPLSDIDMASKSSFTIAGTSVSEPPPEDLSFVSTLRVNAGGSSTSP